MAHEGVRMILEPDSRRQLDEEGRFILWRDGPSPERRVGLACKPSMCPNPGCACQDVHVGCFVIDGQAGSVSWDDEGVHLTGPSGTTSARSTLRGKLVAVVDPDSGETLVHPDFSEEADPALLDWLASELDEELLESLHSYRARVKGYPPERPIEKPDFDDLEEFHLASFDDLLEGVRPDHYLLRGGRYWVSMFLCPYADCNCHELRIVFFDDAVGPEAESGGAVGSVLFKHVGTEGFKIVEQVAEGGAPDQLIRELWALFERRHDVGAYLRRREAQAKAVGATLWLPAEKPVRAGPKIERNAPCPCGSGLKFKRCCLGKAPSERA